MLKLRFSKESSASSSMDHREGGLSASGTASETAEDDDLTPLNSLKGQEAKILHFFDKKASQLDLGRHVHQSQLDEDYRVGGDSELSFHWSDWDESCHLQKQLLQSSGEHHRKKSQLNDNIEVTKGITYWAERNGRRFKLTLFDIFMQYVESSILRRGPQVPTSKANKDKGWDSVLISAQGSTGPFVDLQFIVERERELFLNFIYLFLLQQKIPYRKFRMRCQLAIQGHFPADKGNLVVPLVLKQVSHEGLLFKVSSPALRLMSERNQLKFYLDLWPLKGLERELMELHSKSTLSSAGEFEEILEGVAWHEVCLSAILPSSAEMRRLVNFSVSDTHIFVRYELLREISVTEFDMKNFKKGLSKAQGHFLQQLLSGFLD